MLTAPVVVTLVAKILPPTVVAEPKEALKEVMFKPPVKLVAGNTIGFVTVELMVKESVAAERPRLEIAPAKVNVPVDPAFNVRLKAPPIVDELLEKLILAPPADPPLFVVSKIDAAVRVVAAPVTVIEPAAVVILPPKLSVGLVPTPVYKIPTPPLAVVLTVFDCTTEFPVTVKEVKGVVPPTAPVKVADPPVPAFTVRA